MKCPICNNEIKDIVEKEHPFAHKIVCDKCPTFYVENGFLAKLNNYKDIYGEEKYNVLLNAMLEIVNENKLVIFVTDFEAPATIIDGAVYLEFDDVTDHAHVVIQDINQFFYTD